MNWAALLYLIPYVLSLLISAWVGLYAWRRRTQVGAAAYALLAFSQASWTFGYIFEMTSPDIAGKIFWDNFQFIGGGGWVVGFAAFALQYAGQHVSRPRLVYGLLWLPTIAIVILGYTDPLHHLIRPTAELVADQPFSALLYDFTTVVWAWSIYAYAAFLVCIILLAIQFVRSHRLYRTQIGLVLLGNFIPLGGTVLTITALINSPFRDVTPFTFALGNLVVAWALFRYRLLDVLPVAREAIIENMADAVFVLDAQRRLVDLNPAARRAIQQLDADIIGQPAERVFGAWPTLLDKYQDQAQADQTEIAVDTPLGRRHIELRIQPLVGRRNRPMGQLAIARDITARKQAEEALKQRTAELEQANERLRILSRMKDEFVSNVSHELRTPLTSLKVFLALLATNPRNHRKFIPTLQREADRLESMIEGLLILSRFDQNQVEIASASVDLTTLIEEYITDRTALAEAKGLTLTFDAAGSLPSIRTDPRLIGQVLSILLTNACNYTPSGGQVVVSTHIDQSSSRGWVGFSVTDTGPGIQPEDQPNLFTRFFRGKAGRASSIAGTGLGLALAKEIVDRFHGRIEVSSEGKPGKGTAFKVWLPVRDT